MCSAETAKHDGALSTVVSCGSLMLGCVKPMPCLSNVHVR